MPTWWREGPGFGPCGGEHHASSIGRNAAIAAAPRQVVQFAVAQEDGAVGGGLFVFHPALGGHHCVLFGTSWFT